MSATTITVGTDPTSSSHGQSHPDPWVSLRISQAWGRASVAVLGHKNAATYYSAGGGVGICTQAGTTLCNHPTDQWGFAVVSGIEIKLDSLSPGSRIGGYVTYGQGASRITRNSQTSPGLFGSGNQVAFGVLTDAAYINGSSLELTTTWAAGGGFEYFWTRNFSSTIYGGYTRTEYNNNVIAGRWFCARHDHGLCGGGLRSGLQPVADRHASRLVPGARAPVRGRRALHRRRVRHSPARPSPLARRWALARPASTPPRTSAFSRSRSALSAPGAPTRPRSTNGPRHKNLCRGPSLHQGCPPLQTPEPRPIKAGVFYVCRSNPAERHDRSRALRGAPNENRSNIGCARPHRRLRTASTTFLAARNAGRRRLFGGRQSSRPRHTRPRAARTPRVA